MSNWKAKKLGEILRLEYGKPLNNVDRSVDGKFPVYGANGIKTRSNSFYFDKPSIIVGRKGSAGELALSEDRFWPLDVTYFVTFDSQRYDKKFLYYLLLTLELPKLAKGVKPGINRNDIYSIFVTVPDSLEEQKRIAKILDEAFEIFEKAKVNTEKNLRNAQELFKSYLQSAFSEPTAKWEICNLEEYIKLIDYRGRTPIKTESGVRLITAKNVKLGYLQLNPQEFIDADNYESWMTRGIPNYGDIIFTTEAPLANVAQIDTKEKLAFAQRIIVMQPQAKKIDQTFLKYLLLSKPIRDRILAKGTGATVQGIKSSLLKKIEIYFPNSLIEQESIVKKLDALSEKTKNLERNYSKKLGYLEELKKSILRKAFNGGLTAKEIDKELQAEVQ